MEFLVQSSTRKISDIEESINKFILDTEKYIENMKEEEFLRIRNSMLISLSKKFDNMQSQFYFFMDQISKNENVFNIREKQIRELNEISLGHVLMIFRRYFIEDTKRVIISKVNSIKN